MSVDSTALASAIFRALRALAAPGALALAAGPAGALPLIPVEPTPGILLVQGGPPGAGQQAREDTRSPLSELNDLLGATRAKLEELTEATALVTADAEQRDALQALRKENERLAAELEQAGARAAELERTADLAKTRLAALEGAAEAAHREAARLEEDLAGLRRENERLDQSLARAEAAREATLEQAEARVAALEEAVERSGAAAERLETQLAEARAQLDQAAGAAVAAERARQIAGAEAERARDELAAARDESARLAGANAELEKQIASLQADWRSATEVARHNLMVMGEKIEELNAALERARPNEAPAAAGRARPEAAEDEPDTVSRPPSPMLRPKAEADERAGVEPPAGGAAALPLIGVAAARAESVPVETATLALERLIASLPPSSPSGDARPEPVMTDEPIMTDEEIKAALTDRSRAEPPVAEPAGSPGADRPVERATTLARVDPATAPPKVDPGLASFRANVQSLNQLERSAVGVELFSGIESVKGGEVSVGTTSGWDDLPDVGKQSYLDYLLEAWVAARAGARPAVVRIVDASGRVLVQKSRP
jgi:hypothetical protein